MITIRWTEPSLHHQIFMSDLLISIIIENISGCDISNFTIYARLFEYDWSKIGESLKYEFPIGIQVVTSFDEQFKNNSIIFFDIKIEQASKSFSGRIHLNKRHEDFLITRGQTIIYNSEDIGDVMQLDVAIKMENIPKCKKLKMVTTGCQTDKAYFENKSTQSEEKKFRNAGSITTATCLGLGGIEETVTNVVAQHFVNISSQIVENDEENKKNHHQQHDDYVPTDPILEQPEKSFNVIPRLQKLRALDRIITAKQIKARNAVVEDVHRKRELIMRQRQLEAVQIASEKLRDVIAESEQAMKKPELPKRPSLTMGLNSSPFLKKIDQVSLSTIKDVPSIDELSMLSTAQASSTSDNRRQSPELSPLGSSQSDSSSGSTSDSSSSRSTSTLVSPSQSASSSTSTSLPSSSWGSSQSKFSAKSVSDYESPDRQKLTEIKKSIKPLSPASQYLSDLRERILRESGTVQTD